MGKGWIIGGAVAFAGVAGVVCAAGPAIATPFPWPDGLGPRNSGGGPEGQQLLVHHPPTQAGGPASDTDFLTMTGQPFWQQSADDFLVGSPAVVQRLVWWGFYNLDNPPAAETMRVRFYDARPSDGLPGDVLYEESFLDPSRMATGLVVFVGVDPDEYIYEVNLTTPMALAADTRYWLEIVQVGDQATFFRWEFATAINDVIARRNPSAPDWTYSALNANLAFEVWGVPEPLTVSVLASGVMILLLSRRSRKTIRS